MMDYNKALTIQMFNLHNQERIKLSLGLLKWDEELTKCAYLHTLNMIKHRNIFHVCPKGLGVMERANSLGIKWVGLAENVSYGNKHPQDIPPQFKIYDPRILHQFWGLMSSKGHRENILCPEFNKIGMVVIQDDSHPKWKNLIYTCQVFKL